MLRPMADEVPYEQEDMFGAPAEEAPQATAQGDEKYIYSRASVPKDVSAGANLFAEDLQPFSPPPAP